MHARPRTTRSIFCWLFASLAAGCFAAAALAASSTRGFSDAERLETGVLLIAGTTILGLSFMLWIVEQMPRKDARAEAELEESLASGNSGR